MSFSVKWDFCDVQGKYSSILLHNMSTFPEANLNALIDNNSGGCRAQNRFTRKGMNTENKNKARRRHWRADSRVLWRKGGENWIGFAVAFKLKLPVLAARSCFPERELEQKWIGERG